MVGVVEQIRVQQLHRRLLAGAHVRPAVDLAHAAPAHDLPELVAADRLARVPSVAGPQRFVELAPGLGELRVALPHLHPDPVYALDRALHRLAVAPRQVERDREDHLRHDHLEPPGHRRRAGNREQAHVGEHARGHARARIRYSTATTPHVTGPARLLPLVAKK